MSGNTKEWLVVAVFFVGLFAFSLAEAAWLSRRDLVPFGKGFAFAFATNTFSVTIGFFGSFVVVAVLLALAWDGTIGQMSGNDWRIWTAVIFAALFPVILLILAKRLALRLFKMPLGSPWLFSAAAAVIFMVLVTGTPVLLVYLAS